MSQKMATKKWVRFCATWPELLTEKIRIPFCSLTGQACVPKYFADTLN
jgi:hypothetical protein